MRNHRIFVLLSSIAYLVIVLSSSSINANDTSNSSNDTEDPRYRSRVILRNVRNTFDTDKQFNQNLDLTFGKSTKEWLYTHDAVVNKSCTFSKDFGRRCYVYRCDKGNVLYCELKLRTGPCPESLKTYENSFNCRDIKINRVKDKVHVCKLGGMVRSLGEISKLRDDKDACIYRDLITLSGTIVEELTRRVDAEPRVQRRTRYFRRESKERTEAKEEEDDENFEIDENEDDRKMDRTRKDLKGNHHNDHGHNKSTTEGNDEDHRDTSNRTSTSATSKVDEKDQVEETTATGTADNVTKTYDNNTKTTSKGVTDDNVTTTEKMSTRKKSENEEMTRTSDEERITTTPVEIENTVTTSKSEKVMTTPKVTNEGDNPVDDESFKGTTRIYSVLSKLFREHSDFFTFQIKSRMREKIKEGNIGELMRLKVKTLTKNNGEQRGFVMENLKNKIRELLYCSKTKTMVRQMLNDLGRDLKVDKDGKLFR